MRWPGLDGTDAQRMISQRESAQATKQSLGGAPPFRSMFEAASPTESRDLEVFESGKGGGGEY
jgi:hypothetical protein